MTSFLRFPEGLGLPVFSTGAREKRLYIIDVIIMEK